MTYEPKGPVGTREERGSKEGSHKKPPHVSEAAKDAPLQENRTSPNDVPVRPPNAQGQERIPADEHAQPIDEESAYDRRPEEDKDRPASQI